MTRASRLSPTFLQLLRSTSSRPLAFCTISSTAGPVMSHTLFIRQTRTPGAHTFASSPKPSSVTWKQLLILMFFGRVPTKGQITSTNVRSVTLRLYFARSRSCRMSGDVEMSLCQCDDICRSCINSYISKYLKILIRTGSGRLPLLNLLGFLIMRGRLKSNVRFREHSTDSRT